VKEGVRASWITANEFGMIGFNVWRRVNDGAWKKLNASLIPTKNPGTIMGADYRFTDKTVRTGVLYQYKLEIVATGWTLWSQVLRAKIP
jgi:hypothetical protein